MKFPRGPEIRIHVKAENITKAIEADSSKCWIQEAIREQVPIANHIAVDVATIRFTDPERGYRYVYLTPYTAQKALLDYDDGKRPLPFSFLLRNAHVTRAGAARRAMEPPSTRKAAANRANLAKARLAASGNGGHTTPRRVGGKRPPQLRHMRIFGIRAFRGASEARIMADKLAQMRADEMGK